MDAQTWLVAQHVAGMSAEEVAAALDRLRACWNCPLYAAPSADGKVFDFCGHEEFIVRAEWLEGLISGDAPKGCLWRGRGAT
jgi:hypothetical protein